MYKFAEKVAFQPPTPPSYDENSFSMINGKIPYHLAVSGKGWKNTYTIIFTHGNAEDLGQIAPWLDIVAKTLQVNVLGYDYQGYGYNEGSCSEKASYEDIHTVYKYVKNTLMVPANKIILWGRSLGTGPTTHLAAKLCSPSAGFCSFSASDLLVEQGIAGIILQSPFMSAVTVVTNKLWYVPWSDIFSNYSKIGNINVPIFILHGTNDQVIPHNHSTKLKEKILKSDDTCLYHFWSIPGAGHNDIEANYTNDLFRHLVGFLTYIGK